ncbi:MAG: hypothetical protein M5R36_08275 [Deltaproteobacteria bacterium]|nr:hypothetical protein [Deltaproteobacteria bacterium]
MAKHALMVFELAPGDAPDGLYKKLEEIGWIRTNVGTAMTKAYRTEYDDNDIIGSAKVEFEDLCAFSEVTPKSCAIHVGAQAPGIFSDD